MAFGRIEIRVEPEIKKLFNAFDMLNRSLTRQVKIKNQLLAKRSVEIVKQSMKDAGIKRQSGQLFDSVKATVDNQGYTITLSKLAAILHFGRPDGYEIKSKQAHNLLANPATGFIVSTKKESITHKIKPHPWMARAQNEILGLVNETMTATITGTIRKTWKRRG